MSRSPRFLIRLFAALSLVALPAQAARLEVIELQSKVLQGNPLGDPTARRVAVYAPVGSKAETALPLVIYLPGWGASSEDAIAQGDGSFFHNVVDQLAANKLPVRIAIVDGRCRYGGNQFLNSSATGRYADYVADELFRELFTRYHSDGGIEKGCIIAGHSSGGYGALMLAMSRHERFRAVVAMSPDSDFPDTHLPMVEEPAVRAVRLSDLALVSAPHGEERMVPGLPLYIVGLSSMYAPISGEPRRFEWPYDAAGKWRPEVWQRWLDHDPLSVARDRADAFAPTQRVYLEGAAEDEFKANIGARKIYEVLEKRESPVAFREPVGHHGEHLAERLVEGLKFALGTGK
jgi:pimeloyl-ACP methyl ester carboxylesterase